MFVARALVALGTITVADPGISKLGAGAVHFFGSEVCFDTPLHIPYGFFSENIE